MFTEEIQSLLKSPEPVLRDHAVQGHAMQVGENAEKTACEHPGVRQGKSSFSQEQVKLLRDLKFSIGVQIGGLNVSAHQLLDLSPNQFFEFEINPYTKLSLFIEGEKIATAKFISVNDKLGIEIVEVRN